MYYFVVNPAAGNGRAGALASEIQQFFRTKNIHGEFIKTTTHSDAQHLAAMGKKKGYSTIIIIGGDGTVHDVLNGIAGSDIVLGIIPLGNKNSLAERCGISLDWKIASSEVLARKIISVDVAKILETKTFFLQYALISALQESGDIHKEPREGFLGFFEKKSPLHQNIVALEIIIDRTYRLQFHTEWAEIAASSSDFALRYQQRLPIDDNRLQLYALDSFAKEHALISLSAREIRVESKERCQLLLDDILLGRTPLTIRMAPFQQKIISGKLRDNAS